MGGIFKKPPGPIATAVPTADPLTTQANFVSEELDTLKRKRVGKASLTVKRPKATAVKTGGGGSGLTVSK